MFYEDFIRAFQSIIKQLDRGKPETPNVYISTPWYFTNTKFSNELLLLDVVAFYSPMCIKD